MKNRITLTTSKVLLTLMIAGLMHWGCSMQNQEAIYPVGFSYFEVYDSSRRYSYQQDSIYRPLLIHFWYPSENKSVSTKMRFKEYVDLISIREDYSKPKASIDAESFNFTNAYAEFAKASYSIGKNISTEEILNSPVHASLDISRAKGQFPLIIYAPSNSKSPIQNHLICEDLASQGFYVISVASAGKNSIIRQQSGPSFLAQVKDMEFILQYMEKNIELSYTQLGLLSFSAGGPACALFQMKHPEVKAVCTLDGSHEYSFYLYLTQLEEYDITRTSTPYFLMVNKTASSVYPFYNSNMSSHKIATRMSQLDHFGFVSFWTFFDQCKPDSSPHYLSTSYQYLSKNAISFFEATLKGNENSLPDLPDKLSLDNEFVIAEDLNFSEAVNLLNNYLADSIESAIFTYKVNKLEGNGNYIYSEEEISYLGRTLLDYDIDASIKLFMFNTEEYPKSWHAYYDLGFANKLKNDLEPARNAYRQAHNLNPENQEIIKILAELSNE